MRNKVISSVLKAAESLFFQELFQGLVSLSYLGQAESDRSCLPSNIPRAGSSNRPLTSFRLGLFLTLQHERGPMRQSTSQSHPQFAF